MSRVNYLASRLSAPRAGLTRNSRISLSSLPAHRNLTTSFRTCLSSTARTNLASTPRIALRATATALSIKEKDYTQGVAYQAGPQDVPLIEQPIGEFWDSLVEKYPKQTALIVCHEKPDHHALDFAGGTVEGTDYLRWDYETMGKHIDALARGLLRAGIQKGDRIGVFLGNNSAYALLQWATAKIGAIMVCINPAAKERELVAALNLTECKMLLIAPQLRNQPSIIPLLKHLFPMLSHSQPQLLYDESAPYLRSVYFVDNTHLGAAKFNGMLEREHVPGTDFRNLFDWDTSRINLKNVPKNDANDIINLQFTSGTTGLPKAVSLTHRNILNNGFFIGECMALQYPSDDFGGEILCGSPPLYHCFGLVLGNLAFWTHGGCILYPSESFEPVASLRAVHRERCTALHGVPTMLIAELNVLYKLQRGENVPGLSDLGEPIDITSLRTGIAAGAPVPAATMTELFDKLNLRDITISYGMTETSPVTIMSTTKDSVEKRINTVGKVMPHCYARIVDPAHPSYPDPSTPTVPIGQSGEIWTGGYVVQKGYWNNKEETDKSVFTDEDGVVWMRTGDQAVMDADGYTAIVGRIKDIVIRGGENLFPVVIENRALLLPGIRDCAIIGVADPVMGEVIGAFCQREESQAGREVTGKMLREHITHVLSHQSAPDWVWWLGEDGVPAEFPKTASGKVRKVDLRDWSKGLCEKRVGRVRVP